MLHLRKSLVTQVFSLYIKWRVHIFVSHSMISGSTCEKLNFDKENLATTDVNILTLISTSLTDPLDTMPSIVVNSRSVKMAEVIVGEGLVFIGIVVVLGKMVVVVVGVVVVVIVGAVMVLVVENVIGEVAGVAVRILSATSSK